MPGCAHEATAVSSDVLRAIREAPPPPDRNLRGNEIAEQLLDRVSPPMATRDLGHRLHRATDATSASRHRASGSSSTLGPARVPAPCSAPPASPGWCSPSSSRPRLAPRAPTSSPRTDASGSSTESLVQDLSAASSRLVDRRLHAFRVGRAGRAPAPARRAHPLLRGPQVAGLDPRRSGRDPRRAEPRGDGLGRSGVEARAARGAGRGRDAARGRPGRPRCGSSISGPGRRWDSSSSLARGTSGSPAPSTPPAGCGCLPRRARCASRRSASRAACRLPVRKASRPDDPSSSTGTVPRACRFPSCRCETGGRSPWG